MKSVLAQDCSGCKFEDTVEPLFSGLVPYYNEQEKNRMPIQPAYRLDGEGHRLLV